MNDSFNARKIMELQKLSGMEKFSKLTVKQFMNREKLIELLEGRRCEASEVCGSMNKGFGAWYADHLLTNDVVPVIRCKDCYWRDRNYCMHPTDGMDVTKDDDFCSYGERKNDAQ